MLHCIASAVELACCCCLIDDQRASTAPPSSNAIAPTYDRPGPACYLHLQPRILNLLLIRHSLCETLPSMMDAAVATGAETPNGVTNRPKAASRTLSEVERTKATTADKLRQTPQRKYRHVAAVHSKTRPSCLSHDSEAAPSFLGFRNLMVIVLGTPCRSNTPAATVPSYHPAANMQSNSGGQPTVDD
jgi:hypothetical protein